ncbi:MAG: RNA polymerase sigma factor [Planctomycetes bacterium]|nr:RNA polymerase sigma factor [Planctomycetota bacterium]
MAVTNGPTMKVRNDQALIEAVARERDRSAFAELFERHRNSAYNLACYVTGNRESAEEAVQEAMLRVWTSAATFQPGNVRSWILRIVAREGIRVIRSRNRKRSEMESEQIDRHPSRGAAPEEDAERGELLGALRGMVARLNQGDRELVALYFAGGLSQEEIARELDMPQRTVSFRIQKSIEQLRGALTKAGFAAAVPLLNAEGLGQALAGNAPAPAGLGEQVLAKLSAEGLRRASRAMSRRVAAGGTSWIAGTVAAVLAVGAAGAYLAIGGTESKHAPAAFESAGAQTEAPAGAKEWVRRWSFTGGPPGVDLEVVEGEWSWRPARDGFPAGMVVPAPESRVPDNRREVMVLLPDELPAGPLFVSMRVRRCSMETKVGFGSFVSDGKSYAPFRLWTRSTTLLLDKDCVNMVYYFEQGSVNTVADVPTTLHIDLEPAPRKRLSIGMTEGLILQEVEIRSIREEEVPAKLRDLEALKAGFRDPPVDHAAKPVRSADAFERKPVEDPTIRFERHWSFAKGVPQDILDYNGPELGSCWQPGKDGSPGYLHAPEERKLPIRLPMALPKRPLLITMTLRGNGNKNRVNCGAYWVDGTRIPGRDFWWSPIDLKNTATCEAHVWFWERYCVQFMGGEAFALRRSDKAYPGNQLYAWIMNCNAEEIAVREVTLEDIPAQARAFDVLCKTMKDTFSRVPEGSIRPPAGKLEKSAQYDSIDDAEVRP